MTFSGRRSTTLDERLRWHARNLCTPYTLGEGLCEVGPGWWPLVRRVFATAAETPGAEVTTVKQKCALLQVGFWHMDRRERTRLAAYSEALATASAACCEACGTAVPPLVVRTVPYPTRNHCARCTTRLMELDEEHGGDSERALWMECAKMWLPEWSGWGG
ncbi:hypothetical protein BH09GEM1_BH09GEM1_45380 [soil metagenome]